jgi:hypothetical protein
MLAQLITVAALVVFLFRCPRLLFRIGTTGRYTAFGAMLRRCVLTVARPIALTGQAAVRLVGFMPDQIRALVLAVKPRPLRRRTGRPDQDLAPWWPWRWRHGSQDRLRARAASGAGVREGNSVNDVPFSDQDSTLTGVGGNRPHG